MKFVYSGKDVVSDSLKARTEKKLSKLERYFTQEPEAIVRFKQQKGGRNICEITVSVNGLILRADGIRYTAPSQPATRRSTIGDRLPENVRKRLDELKKEKRE